jgi:hypothetical protein
VRIAVSLHFVRKNEEIDSKVRTIMVLLYILAESTGLGKRENRRLTKTVRGNGYKRIDEKRNEDGKEKGTR